jgi:hypothetical protein
MLTRKQTCDILLEEVNMNDFDNFLNNFRKKIEDVKKRDVNEEDTKNYLIIPFFQKLGWDFSDPSSVKAEDTDDSGKRPDYGFYIDRHENSVPKILIEAKKVNDPLRDVMINQKLVYFDTTGCPFLIITNGELYKIYYSELKGHGKDKLLVEFSLLKEVDDDTQKVIGYLKKTNIVKDALQIYAMNVSLSNKMRKAIDGLLQNPSKEFIKAINAKIKEENNYIFPEDDYKKVLPKFSINIEFGSDNESLDLNVSDIQKGTNTKLTIADHFKNGKWNTSFLLYKKLISTIKKEYNIEENITSVYIGIQLDKKNVFQIEPQKSRINVFLNIDVNKLSEQEQLKLIDVSHVGHHASMSNIKFIINNETDLEWATELIRKVIGEKK